LTYDTYGRLTTVSTAAISTNPLSGTVTTNAVTYGASASTIQTAPGIVLTNPTASGTTVVLTCSGSLVASSGVIGTHYGAIAGSNTIAASSLTLGTALSVANGGTGLTSTSQNYLFAGPASGGSGAPTFRALAAGDLPASGVGAGATVGSTTAIPVLTYDTYGRLTAVSTASISTNPLSGTVTTSAVTYAASASTIQTAPGVVLTNPTASDSSVVLTCSGDIVAYSDRNIKTNIEQIPDALEKVLKIGGYTFNRKDGGSERRTGVIAQEVQAVLPEAVYKTDDGTLTVAYGNMVGLLIEAIKELQGSLDSAHKRITELENKFQS
jgi:hypothetical protein